MQYGNCGSRSGRAAVTMNREGETNPARYARMGSEGISPRIGDALCLVPLRYSTLADEVWAHQSKTTCIATKSDPRRGFIELPAR